MTIKKELNKIICEQIGGVDPEMFTIELYINEGWITEDHIYNAVKTLLRKRRGRK